MSILSSILARKEREITSLPSFDVRFSSRRSLVSAVTRKFPSLIAEIKPISPTQGRLVDDTNIPGIVDLYNRHAQAISVLCDEATFGGGFDLLASVRAQTDLPILAKDFILTKKQVDAAAFCGADAVLLIVSILTKEELRQLAGYAISLGMDVLLELHEAEEIEGARVLLESMLEAERMHMLLGINNRDLKTQKIDLKTTKRLGGLLRACIKDLPPLISESGIVTPADISHLSSHVQGFLIGSAILQSEHPDDFLHSLFRS